MFLKISNKSQMLIFLNSIASPPVETHKQNLKLAKEDLLLLYPYYIQIDENSWQFLINTPESEEILGYDEYLLLKTLGVQSQNWEK